MTLVKKILTEMILKTTPHASLCGFQGQKQFPCTRFQAKLSYQKGAKFEGSMSNPFLVFLEMKFAFLYNE